MAMRKLRVPLLPSAAAIFVPSLPHRQVKSLGLDLPSPQRCLHAPTASSLSALIMHRAAKHDFSLNAHHFLIAGKFPCGEPCYRLPDRLDGGVADGGKALRSSLTGEPAAGEAGLSTRSPAARRSLSWFYILYQLAREYITDIV